MLRIDAPAKPGRKQQDELLVMLTPVVVRAVRLIVGPGSAIAEDAAQEALLALHRDLPGLRDPNAARAFATRTAARVAVRIAQRERRLSRIGLRDARSPTASAPVDASRVAIQQAFAELPPRMRAVAVLRLYLDLSERETAAALGCSTGAVKSQLNRARAVLARHLDTGDTP